MCSELSDVILDQIDQADLSATAYRSAVRLMRLAMANDGQVRLSRPAAVELCGSESDATMRTHLYQIGRAGIVEYHAGADVFVKFLSWPLRAERANDEEIDTTLRAERANEAAEIETLRAERANEDEIDGNLRAERANEGSTSHARSGWVGRSLTTTEKRKKPTHLPPKTLEPMQQLAFELLIDSEVGVLHRVANELARTLPASEIFRMVDKWLPKHQADEVGTGALVSRLREVVPKEAKAVKLSAGFRDSELFHRHRLPDEMVADPERKQYNYVPEPEQGKRYRP
jgi:hypothetical protein